MSRKAGDQAELEQRAERAVRRGELLVALEHFDAYLAQNPEDERVPQPGTDSLSEAEMGEMHASSGRFDEATQAYQRALAANPANELLRERLEGVRGPFTPPPAPWPRRRENI